MSKENIILTSITDEHIGKLISCEIELDYNLPNTFIEEGFIYKEKNNFYILQNHRFGSAPRDLPRKLYKMYKASWCIMDGTNTQTWQVHNIQLLDEKRLSYQRVSYLIKKDKT